MKRNTILSLLLAGLFASVFQVFELSGEPALRYVKTRIIIKEGGDDISRQLVGNTLTAIVQEANKLHEGLGDISNVRELCTEGGFSALKGLIENTSLFTTATEYQTRLLITHTQKYEIRGIDMKVELGETEGDPIQELVFVLNSRFFVENIHFALEKHDYEKLWGRPNDNRNNNLLHRQKIIDFIEEYRTAHNSKDIAFLRDVYSDDALIIVGHVLQKKENGGDLLAHSSLGQEKIQFIRLNKQQYITRLQSAFESNSFIRVTFDDIKIKRHHKFDEIYGITLKQRWNASRYSDEGYLFVMLDFKNQQNPLIHVRSWQPEPFSDGSTVGLGDFKIIDSDSATENGEGNNGE